MLANIRQHAAYIASTIGYIDDQIAADTCIVTDASVSFYRHTTVTFFIFDEFALCLCLILFLLLSFLPVYLMVATNSNKKNSENSCSSYYV